MDRFKFRAWDKSRQRMHGGMASNLMLNLDGWLFWQFGMSYPELLVNEELDNYILMQCTGLKDAEGKLVYESDILVHPDYGHLQIKWSNGEFYCHNFNTHVVGEDHYTMAACDEAVVIGNIYENPELLTTPQEGDYE